MSKVRTLQKKGQSLCKMRLSPPVEESNAGLALSRKKMVKKTKGFTFGLMVGPIDPKCWEPPDPELYKQGF